MNNKEKYQKIRDGWLEQGIALASSNESFRILCALYWGEGKKDRNVFCVSNCDAGLLNIISQWLINNGYKYGFRVQYYQQDNISEQDIKAYWCDKIPTLRPEFFKKFRTCEVKRQTQNKGCKKQPYGTASIEVCNTQLVQKVLGGIEFLRTHMFNG